jgi:hypothetical protein
MIAAKSTFLFGDDTDLDGETFAGETFAGEILPVEKFLPFLVVELEIFVLTALRKSFALDPDDLCCCEGERSGERDRDLPLSDDRRREDGEGDMVMDWICLILLRKLIEFE